jgi:acetyl-CoA carboxylase alpha subunit
MPLITFIDTPGPKIGIEYERRGLAGAISAMIDSMAGVETPTISVLIGEGGSEAALAFSVSDRFLMLQNAIYSPMAPEEAAGELRDSGREHEVAKALRLTSNDCIQMGIIDGVVPEPIGGAHAAPGEAARLLKRSLMRDLSDLRDVHRRTLARRRQKKYRKMGEYGSRFRLAVRGEVRAWQAAFSAGVKAFRRPDADEDKPGTGETDSKPEGDARPEAQNE